MSLKKRYETISVRENIKLRRDLDEQEARILGQIQDAIGGSGGELSKTLAYNMDGKLETITTAEGTKTFIYNLSGKLEQIIGTGIYPTKTLSYDINGKLESITIS